MSGVRPLARGDLEQVAQLYELGARTSTRKPPEGLAAYFGRVFLDGPCLGPGLQPLVHETKGRIQGFIGVHARRIRFDGEPHVLVATGPLFTEADARLVSALLVKAVFDGPQLLTITDGATIDAARLWERSRGSILPIGAVRWTKTFRPWRLASGVLAKSRRVGPFWRPFDVVGRPLWATADALTRSLMRGAAPAAAAELRAEELDAARLVEGQAALAPHYKLRPDHDLATCTWLLDEMRFAVDRGPLRARLLRDGGGRVAGWFLYFAPRGGIARVVQVAAMPRHYEDVLSHLFADADAIGVAALQGRMEARLVAPLRTMGVSLHYDHSLSLIHSRDPRVYAAVLGGESMLSRLDGEWFFSFQSLPLAARP